MVSHIKFYELVKKAEKEYGEALTEISEEPKKEVIIPRIPQTYSIETHRYPDFYENLKTNLFSCHSKESLKTILFLGTTHGDGATTTALNFANALAQDRRLNILVIEANFRTPILHEMFNVDPANCLTNLLPDKDMADCSIKKVESENLYVIAIGSKLDWPVSLFGSQRFWEFLNRMRTEFDYIILDGPPLPSFTESKVICNKVDGVVMVIEAGKTRKQVALRAKKDIVEAGGKFLGVVLNKRKYHIPKWIYKHL